MTGLTYTPGDLAQKTRTVARAAALKAEEDRRKDLAAWLNADHKDRAWRTLRKMVAGRCSDAQLHRFAARNF